MKEKKNDSNKKVHDLKFVPLDIKDPLKFLNTDLINFTNSDTIIFKPNSDFLLKGFPQLNVNIFTELPEIKISDVKAPQMKYPDDIPDLNPDNLVVDTKQNANTPQNIMEEQLEYPSETSSDELYSYNKTTEQDKTRYDYDYEPINPIDILRNFDLLDDFDNDSRHGYSQQDVDNILKDILDNNNSVMAILKAYRVPYPIAKLLIKKVIRITLEQRKR